MKRKFPARRNTARTATHDTPATSATAARVLRPTFAVNAMKDGTTASGFTIVISAAKDKRATFHKGTPLLDQRAESGEQRCDLQLYDDVAAVIDVPEHAAMRPAGQSLHR